MIFYKKIEIIHTLESKKSYIYLGNYILETEIEILDISFSSSKASGQSIDSANGNCLKKENEVYHTLFKDYTENKKL